MNFFEEYNLKKKIVEEEIDKIFKKEKFESDELKKIMEYGVLNGGKRIRPILFLSGYEMVGKDFKEAVGFACSLEFIHSYSLIHDDLPAMDNDELRRGKPTCHVKFSHYGAILAGDALLNYAFETAAKAFTMYPEKSLLIGKAMQILAGKAGIYGMIGGQVVDIESEGTESTLDTVEFIHELKTGALIESAMMIGATLAGASEEEIQAVEKIARNVGVAFQIQDDILDVTSTAEVLGKPILSDEKNGKRTYVTFVGLEKAKEAVETLSMEAVSLLSGLPAENPFLELLLKSLIHREK